MIAAISPEGYVWIVGGLAFLLTICLWILAAAANVTLKRCAAWRKNQEEVERFREELDREHEHDLVKAIGGCRVSAEDRWAA